MLPNVILFNVVVSKDFEKDRKNTMDCTHVALKAMRKKAKFKMPQLAASESHHDKTMCSLPLSRRKL